MSDDKLTVVVRDINIPFWRVVWIMIKWSLAAIPAVMILLIIYMVCLGVIAVLYNGMTI